MREYIDASIFLGMHSKNEKIRIVCKNYIVRRLNNQISMSLEQIGICDNIIWQYPREQQDAYYPFMDNLHTIMNICRVSYTEKDIREAIKNPQLQDLNISDRLTVAMVWVQGAELYSVNPLLKCRDSVHFPEAGKELTFPLQLEKLYQQSLAVRI